MSWRGAIKAGTDTAVDILKEDAKANRAAELYQLKRQNSYDDSLKLHKEKSQIDAQTTKAVLDSNYGFKNLKEFDTQIRTQAKAAIGQTAVESWGKIKDKDVARNAWDKSAHATDLSKVYKAAYSSGMKELSIPVLSNMILSEAKTNAERATNKSLQLGWVKGVLGSYKDPTLEGLRGNIPPALLGDRIHAQKSVDALINSTDISIEAKKQRLIQFKKTWEARTGLEW